MSIALKTLPLLVSCVFLLDAPDASAQVQVDPKLLGEIATAACLQGAPNSSLTGAQINLKTPASHTVFLRTPDLPANKPAKWYSNAACGQRFVADFALTSASALTDTGFLQLHIDVNGRKGPWPAIPSLALGDLDEEGKCTGVDKSSCLTKLCTGVFSKVTYAWKKHGDSDFKTYRVSYLYYEDTGSACQPAVNPKLRGNGPGTYNPDKTVGPGTTTQGQADGFRRLPKAGQTDVYRVIAESGVAAGPLWENTQAGPSFTTMSRTYVKQLPVQAVVAASNY